MTKEQVKKVSLKMFHELDTSSEVKYIEFSRYAKHTSISAGFDKSVEAEEIYLHYMQKYNTYEDEARIMELHDGTKQILWMWFYDL